MNKEEHLMNCIRKGDEDAFSILVEDLLPVAYKTAYLVLQSEFFAKDAVQLALEDCYLSIMKNYDIRNFKPWFYRLVYTRSIDLYRKNSRNLYTTIDENPEAISKINSESALEQAIQSENKNEMINLILTLEKEQSIPILLYYYEELTIKEISLVLNENINTVKTRLKRGRKKLAKLIKMNQDHQTEVNSYGI